MAYDILEHQGIDIRAEPLERRRELLESLLKTTANHPVLKLSPIVKATDWQAMALQQAGSRSVGAEGLMLKRKNSPYQAGRPRGDWWKWKVEPYTVDAVVTAVQRGSGKRASLYTDYTFSVWKDGELVPFAKAYSGLTDEEIKEVDGILRKHLLEKFGPVRTVEPVLVFELGFEAIQRSPRHKSGLAVRFPRILRWRKDKTVEQADTVATIEQMLIANQPQANRKDLKKDSNVSREGFLFEV